MNRPNRLTLLRMCLVPVFVACFYLDAVLPWWNLLAAGVFLLASATDLVDGWYARKHALVTDFGKLLDPMADKLLFCSAFIMLVGTGELEPLFAIVFVGREFIISAFRLIAVALILLGNPLFGRIGVPMDRIVLYIALVLTVWSLVDYLVKNRKVVHGA